MFWVIAALVLAGMATMTPGASGQQPSPPPWPAWVQHAWGRAVIGQPALFLYSQAGFDVRGNKQILVWRPIAADQWAAATAFELKAVPGQEGSEPYHGQLGQPFPFPWGGSAAVADFSSWTQPGRYTLTVDLSGEKEPVRSPEFDISAGLYQRLGQEAAIWFYPQRCGEAVPGWHAACHLDDGVFRDLQAATYGQISGAQDAVGGWHDAGDFNKWMPYAWIGIYALTEQWAVLRQDTREFGEALPDPLAEASREVRLVLKILRADGWLPNAVQGWHPNLSQRSNNPWGHWGTPETETDNRPGTGDERWISPEWSDKGQQEVMTAWMAAALAYFAQEVKPFDAVLADQSAQAAARILSLYDRREITPASMESFAGLMAAHLHLALARGQSPDNADTQRYVRALLLLRDLWTRPGIDVYHWPLLMIWGLLEYADAVPNSPFTEQIRTEVPAYLRGVVANSTTPGLGTFGAFAAVTPATSDPLPSSWQGYNPYFAGTAYVLARAGRAGSDPSLVAAADRQMQWILGRNPLGMSMLVGEGSNPEIYHTRYVTIPGHYGGVIPGGVLNGILPASAGIPGNEKGQYLDIPADAPVLAIMGKMGHLGWWQTNEYWIPNNGWFLLGAVRLAQAYRDAASAAEQLGSRSSETFDALAWSNRVWRELE